MIAHQDFEPDHAHDLHQAAGDLEAILMEALERALEITNDPVPHFGRVQGNPAPESAGRS